MPKRRSTAQIARDRRVISNLYMKGWLQSDIANELGISDATVSRDLRTLYKRWERSSLVDIDSKKAEELAKIDHLEREYWEAWERKHPPRSFRDGDYLPLLGENWRLSLREEAGRRRPLIRHESSPLSAGTIKLTLPAGLDEASRRELAGGSLQRWYRRLARRIIEARVEHWAPVVGARTKKIGIRYPRIFF